MTLFKTTLEFQISSPRKFLIQSSSIMTGRFSVQVLIKWPKVFLHVLSRSEGLLTTQMLVGFWNHAEGYFFKRSKHIIGDFEGVFRGGQDFFDPQIVMSARKSSFFYFQWQKVDQVRSEYLRSYLNWLHNWQLKNRRRSHALKGSHSMGDGRIFLKTSPEASFKKYLSKEPNFDQIHLAGQYL